MKEKDAKYFVIRFHKDDHKFLKDLAQKNELSMAYYWRQAIKLLKKKVEAEK